MTKVEGLDPRRQNLIDVSIGAIHKEMIDIKAWLEGTLSDTRLVQTEGVINPRILRCMAMISVYIA